MLLNPRVGSEVQAWYATRDTFPLHGRVGTVVIASRGKPRNHAVRFGSATHIVPCGNLRKPKGSSDG